MSLALWWTQHTEALPAPVIWHDATRIQRPWTMLVAYRTGQWHQGERLCGKDAMSDLGIFLSTNHILSKGSSRLLRNSWLCTRMYCTRKADYLLNGCTRCLGQHHSDELFFPMYPRSTSRLLVATRISTQHANEVYVSRACLISKTIYQILCHMQRWPATKEHIWRSSGVIVKMTLSTKELNTVVMCTGFS